MLKRKIRVTINFFDMIVAALAVWRLAHMLRYEAGPWDVFIRIREKLGNGVFGKAMDCVACMSIWLAAIIFFVPGIRFLVVVLAISAMAVVLEAVHGMLRKGSEGTGVGEQEVHKNRLPRTGIGI